MTISTNHDPRAVSFSVCITKSSAKVDNIHFYILHCHRHKPLIHEHNNTKTKLLLHESAHNKVCGFSWVTGLRFLESDVAEFFKYIVFMTLFVEALYWLWILLNQDFCSEGFCAKKFSHSYFQSLVDLSSFFFALFRFKVANWRHFILCLPATTSCTLMCATASYTTFLRSTAPVVSVNDDAVWQMWWKLVTVALLWRQFFPLILHRVLYAFADEWWQNPKSWCLYPVIFCLSCRWQKQVCAVM